MEQGAAGVCGRAEGRAWPHCAEAAMPAHSRARRVCWWHWDMQGSTGIPRDVLLLP